MLPLSCLLYNENSQLLRRRMKSCMGWEMMINHCHFRKRSDHSGKHETLSGLKLFLQQLVSDTRFPLETRTLQPCQPPDPSQNDPSIIWILTISMRNWPRFLCSCHTFPKKRMIRLKPYNPSSMMVHLKVRRKDRMYIMIENEELTCFYYRDCWKLQEPGKRVFQGRQAQVQGCHWLLYESFGYRLQGSKDQWSLLGQSCCCQFGTR